jgi:SAM-dependent methyltransferase
MTFTASPRWHYSRMLKHIRLRLMTWDGLSKVARDPSLATRFLRHWIWNANFREATPLDLLAKYRDSVEALDRLACLHGAPLRPRTISEAFGDVSRTRDCIDLGGLFDRHGSDKATVHDYHMLYAALLSGRRLQSLTLLEIGLGTNTITVRSNMGPSGRPGASLRAFRDWAPQADIHGADIDRSILFSEDRITTYWVDQTDAKSAEGLGRSLASRKFDLIIDDGLHEPHANLNTVAFALDRLKPGGYVVVEDILPASLPLWRIAAAILRPPLAFEFLQTKAPTLA